MKRRGFAFDVIGEGERPKDFNSRVIDFLTEEGT
jgi:hypothetical protein